MFNFSMEAPSNLSVFFPLYIPFIFLLTLACRATNLRCVSHINYWPLLWGEQMIGISEQRGEGERLHVRTLLGNDGDGVEEDGIEKEGDESGP